MNSVNLKKGCAKRNHPSKFSVFRSRLHRDSLAYKSVKRSVINIRRSMLGVRCSTFNIFTVPAAWTFIWVTSPPRRVGTWLWNCLEMSLLRAFQPRVTLNPAYICAGNRSI
jgi:hypothetical protein